MSPRRALSVYVIPALCLLVVGGLPLCGCDLARWEISPAPVPTATPYFTPDLRPTATLLRVPSRAAVILSWIGARDQQIDLYRRQGMLPILDGFASQGVEADHLVPSYPPQSVPSHAVLATGVSSGRVGLVSERFHMPGTSLNEVIDLSEGAAYGVEPLWRRAMRRGLLTAVVCWPGVLPDQERHRAHYVVSDGRMVLPAARHVISLTRTLRWDGAPSSYSPYLSGELVEPSSGESLGYVLATDSHDDSSTTYDRFFFTRAQRIDNDAREASRGDWIPWRYAGPVPNSGGWLLVTSSDPLAFTVYQTEVRCNTAHPEDLLWELDLQLGPPPQVPDRRALEWGWIDAGQYMEMLARRVRWIEESILLLKSRHAPDVICAAQDALEQAERALWLSGDRQQGYTVEKVRSYAGALEETYRILDASLGRVQNAFDLASTSLFLVSPHGQQPVHSVFNVNVLLEREERLALAESDDAIAKPHRVVLTQTQAIGIASGGVAHIYLNMRNREVGGVVTRTGAVTIMGEIVRAIQSVTDTITGASVFASVTTDASHLVGEGAALAGDIIAHANEGYVVADRFGSGELIAPTDLRASDGYHPVGRSRVGIFYAAGRGIRRDVAVGPVDGRSLAPTVAELLGFDLEGHIASEPLRVALR
jgi:predicted AlkP superfamily phosphohydrolase/phosphomutase